jgi:chaperone modulatory protein CbpM
MRNEHGDVLWLDESAEVSLEELARLSHLSEAELLELVEYGVIAPVGGETRAVFRASCVVAARTAGRLREDFELDPDGVALALTLLERIRDLEAQVRRLEALLPR